MRSKLPIKLVCKMFSNTPGIGIRITKALYHKHIRADRDYARGDGVATSPPQQISLRITNACNHRCAVCGQYGKHGYMKTDRGKELLKTLPVSSYKKLIDEVAATKPILYVTGGEPMLYPGIFELMKYAKQKGLIATLVTNGFGLKEHAEEIVKNKWDQVLVSLDGPEDVHDSCRNLKGAFKTAYEGIVELQAMKRKYRVKKPWILTSTTLSEVNAPRLEECFEIGKKLKPDVMVIYLSWFTSEKIGAAQQKILKKELGEEAFTWRSYVKDFSPKQANMIAKALSRVKEKSWPFDYLIIPDVGDKDYAKYYSEPENFFGYSKCVAPFIMVDVMPNGDVTTCRDFVDLKVGNITEKPILEIWNDKKFVAFRKLLIKKGGTLPQCSRCCGLMGF